MSLDAYTRRKLLAAPVFLLVCFIMLEISVRVLCHVDEDGNRWFEGARLKPYHLPVRRITNLVRGYEAARDSRSLVYDPDMGWVGRVSRDSSDDRERVPASATAAASSLRIAVFGASYTAGWWRWLEDSLNTAGIPAHVVNFGCGGYGMDQALLRWRKHGASFRPDIVLFGFSRQDCENNLNLSRLLLEPETGIPFLKPRFLLENDRLRLINAPTPPVRELPSIVASFGAWPLASHEHYFQPTNFQTPFWRQSVLLAILEARITAAQEREALATLYDEHSEAGKLTLRILRQFRSETEVAGCRFYVVHLPQEDDLQALHDTGACPFPGLLEGVSRIAPVIRPDFAMLNLARGQDLSNYFTRGHYTKEFNSVIGRTLASALIASRDSVLLRHRTTKN